MEYIQRERFLTAHEMLMKGLVDDAGFFRTGGVGVMSGDKVVHMAPQADRVSQLIHQLFDWLNETEVHPLVSSCVFHYEFEFIHPFADGNGRMGRLWQTLILSKWQPVFSYIPVESLVYQNQDAYYLAIRQSTQTSESTPFIEFMLEMIKQAIIDRENETTQITTHKTTQNQKAILKYLSKNSKASRREMAQDLSGISENGIKYNLKVLQQTGLLERIGSARGGYWKVIE